MKKLYLLKFSRYDIIHENIFYDLESLERRKNWIEERGGVIIIIEEYTFEREL